MRLLALYEYHLRTAKVYLENAPKDCTDYAITEGITHFDTAISYMQSICILSNDYKRLYSEFLLSIIRGIELKERSKDYGNERKI